MPDDADFRRNAGVPLLQQIRPQRIAIFRALQLGDLLCAVPAFRALRAACPKATITLIGLPWARDLVARLRYLDDFIEFSGYPGLPERTPDPQALRVFFSTARARRFDLAIQMHGSGEITNSIVHALGACHSAGFTASPAYANDSTHYLPWPEHAPEVHRHLALVERLGAPSCGEALELPIRPQEQAEAAALRQRFELRPGAYACVHPGARLASRRWPPQRFAAIADALAQRGLRIVFTGAADDAAVIAATRAAARCDSVDLTGLTSIGALAALVADARLIVCNDTGMSHVAAAMATPSVVISSGADASRWAPLDRSRHRVLWHNVACRPCAHDRCPTGHECALGVSVASVLAAANAMLLTEARRAA